MLAPTQGKRDVRHRKNLAFWGEFSCAMDTAQRGGNAFHRLLLFLVLFSTPGAPFVSKQPSIVLGTIRRASPTGRIHRNEDESTSLAPVAHRCIPAARKEQHMVTERSGVEPIESFRELAASAAARQQQRTRKLSSATAKPNSKTDRFVMKKFHHVEFYCGDATAAAARFVWGLGMSIVAKSDQSTGNTQHASYVVKSNDLCFVCTAPYALATSKSSASVEMDGPDSCPSPFPGFDPEAAHLFFRRHGMAGKAIGIEVEDAKDAYEKCTVHGGIGVQPPTRVTDRSGRGEAVISEVKAYGDVVIRFISFGDGHAEGEGISPTFLPNFEDVEQHARTVEDSNFGLQRADHIVGNVWDLVETVDHLAGMTGMHEFAEFTAADVGTVDSGLNSIVLASNSEMVLMPVNEPILGTPKKSQIQTFLEQNDGAGIQHVALKTNDIFRTVRLMRANSGLGGFEFMESPGPEYYRSVPNRTPSLTEDQLKDIEELGLLADQEDEGILLQVFTKPVGDRSTFFFEIVQRIGCVSAATSSRDEDERDRIKFPVDSVVEMLQRPGCGGFGLGNFKDLFEAVEKYESTLMVGMKEEG